MTEREVAVPSWSGRNMAVLQGKAPLPSSPSPHGRVGTCGKWLQARPANEVAVPSWSGRNRICQGDRNGRVDRIAVPSRSGRNLSLVCRCPKLPKIGRRPLMVGSEQVAPTWTVWGLLPRRPLMVGSEQLRAEAIRLAAAASPSPHGRVGTLLERRLYPSFHFVAVPSWSGRNDSATGEILLPEVVAVPSWSGRNALWLECVKVTVRRSPSPHGRVGTLLERRLYPSFHFVAVPSWSGRNLTKLSP